MTNSTSWPKRHLFTQKLHRLWNMTANEYASCSLIFCGIQYYEFFSFNEQSWRLAASLNSKVRVIPVPTYSLQYFIRYLVCLTMRSIMMIVVRSIMMAGRFVVQKMFPMRDCNEYVGTWMTLMKIPTSQQKKYHNTLQMVLDLIEAKVPT